MIDSSGVKKKFLIIVVDDDRAVRLMLRHALESEGYGVIEADNGAKALFLCEQHQPDIVLMDCMMPVLDGITACSRLQKFSAGARPSVLMITGLEDQHSVELAFDAGAADFITKPIHWPVLIQRVKRLLQARQIEELLNKSEQDAKSFISHALDGIITIDGFGRIQSFNPAAEKIFGFKLDEAFNKDVRLLVPGAFRSDDLCKGENQTPGDDKINISRETTGVRRDGTVFPLLLTITGYFSGERLLTLRDMTEYKKAENKLRLVARVFENIAEGIMVISGEGIIQSVNPAFTAITGYGEEELLGRNVAALDYSPLKEYYMQTMLSALNASGYWEGEVWERRKNGEAYPAWISSSAIKDRQPGNTQYLLVVRDITDQVRLREEREKLLEQAAAAQRLTSLGTISAGIAHEISQPLNSIKVMVDGMIYWHKRGRAPEQEKILENLRKVSNQAGRIDDIIKHMRSFVSAGRATHIEPFSINDAVEGALGMIGHQLSAHGVIVEKKLAANLPLVSGNRNRFEEAVVNLLVNALQALDLQGGYKKIMCHTYQLDKAIVLEISDNAGGIEEKLLDSIFEPFFSTKKTGEGMGLGLSIVQSIIASYRGEIKACNNGSNGATFIIKLPVMYE